MHEIETPTTAKIATDHELANNWRDARKNGEKNREEMLLTELLQRGIGSEEAEEIR